MVVRKCAIDNQPTVTLAESSATRELSKFPSTAAQRPDYGFFGVLGTGLRLSATAWAPGCEDDTGIRLAAGCSVAAKFVLCVLACEVDGFCWTLGAMTLLEAPSKTSCTPVSVKWSGLTSCAFQAGERTRAAPRPTMIMGIFNIPKCFIRDLRLNLHLGPGNH